MIIGVYLKYKSKFIFRRGDSGLGVLRVQKPPSNQTSWSVPPLGYVWGGGGARWYLYPPETTPPRVRPNGLLALGRARGRARALALTLARAQGYNLHMPQTDWVRRSYSSRSHATCLELNELADTLDVGDRPRSEHPEVVRLREYLGLPPLSGRAPKRGLWAASAGRES